MIEKQFVAFKVHGNHFCIDIMQVQEVVRENQFTYMPNFPDFVEGVINLRGVVTPVVSIYKKLDEQSNNFFDNNSQKGEMPSRDEFISENLNLLSNKNHKSIFENSSKLTRNINYKLIIVKVSNIIIGLLVDSLDKILTVNYSDIQNAESVARSINHNMVSGVINVDNQVYIILDVQGILQTEEENELNAHFAKQ